jgi:hypothetical protein
MRGWSKEDIDSLLSSHSFTSLREWRELESGSYQAAARLKIVAEMADKFKLEYNPRKARYREDNSNKG